MRGGVGRFRFARPLGSGCCTCRRISTEPCGTERRSSLQSPCNAVWPCRRSWPPSSGRCGRDRGSRDWGRGMSRIEAWSCLYPSRSAGKDYCSAGDAPRGGRLRSTTLESSDPPQPSRRGLQAGAEVDDRTCRPLAASARWQAALVQRLGDGVGAHAGVLGEDVAELLSPGIGRLA